MSRVWAEAASLMASNPDVVVATGGRVVPILMQLSRSIPIVVPGFVYNPDNPSAVFFRRAFEAAALPLAIEPLVFTIHGLADIDRSIAGLAEQQNAAVLFPPDLTTQALREEVVALAARHRLPAIYADAMFVKIGGLASYAPDRLDIYRRAAGYVDRILRGEKAGDLPFQQPTKFELVFNLKTAKALGLTIPETLLVAADEVIE